MLTASSLKNLNIDSFIAMLNSSKSRMVMTALFTSVSVLLLVFMVKILLVGPPVVAAAPVKNSSSVASPRWNWFPSVRQAVEEVVQEKNAEELARATIKAELLGVVITENDSYAAISTTANPQGLYSVGDSIENNVTLEEIQDYRVVISQRGSRRQIPLKSLDASRAAEERSSLIEVGPDTGANSGFNLSGLVATTPIQLPNGAIGLKLGGLSEDLTDLADVQEGDVVTAVNGTDISQMLTNPLLWQQFSQQTNMPITILRGDEEIELFVNAASLSQKILPRLGAGQVN